jgi:O-acetyl-ADP-ribose deacetylase (regulator of RNase III)
MEKEFLDGKILVKVGDITDETTDAIVNAANLTLMGGGGVDGAIHAKGGTVILEECKKIRQSDFPEGLPTGEAVITTAGNLPSKFVIHTVGPIYGQNAGRDGELLADSYINSLKLAAEKFLETIAFPSISTGAFYFPKHQAAKVSSAAIKEFLKQDSSIRKIHLVFFSLKDAEMFVKHQNF